MTLHRALTDRIYSVFTKNSFPLESWSKPSALFTSTQRFLYYNVYHSLQDIGFVMFFAISYSVDVPTSRHDNLTLCRLSMDGRQHFYCIWYTFLTPFIRAACCLKCVRLSHSGYTTKKRYRIKLPEVFCLVVLINGLELYKPGGVITGLGRALATTSHRKPCRC